MRARLVVALGSLAAAACTTMQPGDRSAALTAAEASRQILVTVHQESSAALGLLGDPDNRYLRRRGYGPSPRVDRTLTRIAREHGVRRVRGWQIGSIGIYCEVFELGPDHDMNALLAALAEDPRIDLAQPMNTFEALGRRYNDPLADLQTAVTKLAVETAHDLATGRGVKVALVDSQVDVNHPDLRDRVLFDRDLVRSGRGRASAEVHGTAVAGIIASAANNTEGIVGVAPDVELAALRACWSVEHDAATAHCSSFSLALALELALDLDADVINLSLTGPHDPLLARLLDALISTGVVVVAAIPESGKPGAGFPASHAGVIAARSDDHGVAETDFALLVSAPGREVLTTTPRAGYGFFSGNSFAAAHVSGVAALLLERSPGITARRIVELMTASADPIDPSVNACRSVAPLIPEASCYEPEETIALEAR